MVLLRKRTGTIMTIMVIGMELTPSMESGNIGEIMNGTATIMSMNMFLEAETLGPIVETTGFATKTSKISEEKDDLKKSMFPLRELRRLEERRHPEKTGVVSQSELLVSSNFKSDLSPSLMDIEHHETGNCSFKAQIVNMMDNQCSLKHEPMEIEKHSNNTKTLRLFSWNARSIANEEKLRFIEESQSDIICIQESWLNNDIRLLDYCNEPVWNTVRFDREDSSSKGGGGTLTLLSGGIVIRRIRLSKDYGLLKLAYMHQSVWLANVYLSTGSKTQIRELFYNLDRYIPREEMRSLFVIGDFNVDLEQENDRLALLEALAKEIGLGVRRPECRTRRNATLDFMLAPIGARIDFVIITTNLSDHAAVEAKIELPKFDKVRSFRVVNKKLASTATEWALANADCAAEFLPNINICRRKNKRSLFVALNRRQVDRKLFIALSKDRDKTTRLILNEYWKI